MKLKYEIIVPNGVFKVHLHFAEIFEPAFRTGARVFDVFVQAGGLVANDLDVYKAAGGGNKAYILMLEVTVTSGSLTVEFHRVYQYAKISAIEIRPVSTPDTDESDAPSASPSESPSESPTGDDGVRRRANLHYGN